VRQYNRQSTIAESNNKTPTIGRVNQYSPSDNREAGQWDLETIRRNNGNTYNRTLLVTWTLTLPPIHGPDIESPIGGDDMTADILMKALPHWKVTQHALGLGLSRPCGGVMELEWAGAPAVEAE